MKKYAKIINNETKQCEVGLGTNSAFYQSIGMTEIEVEQSYDGSWYVKGFAPEKPVEELQAQVRAVRNQYLEQTDKYMITDYPITDEERELYRQYREYLRTYPECRDWYKANPKTYEEWKSLQTTNNNDVSLEQMSDICKDCSESIEKLAKAVYYISQHSTERY